MIKESRIINFFPAFLNTIKNKKQKQEIFTSNFGKSKVGKFQVYLYIYIYYVSYYLLFLVISRKIPSYSLKEKLVASCF